MFTGWYDEGSKPGSHILCLSFSCQDNYDKQKVQERGGGASPFPLRRFASPLLGPSGASVLLIHLLLVSSSFVGDDAVYQLAVTTTHT